MFSGFFFFFFFSFLVGGFFTYVASLSSLYRWRRKKNTLGTGIGKQTLVGSGWFTMDLRAFAPALACLFVGLGEGGEGGRGGEGGGFFCFWHLPFRNPVWFASPISRLISILFFRCLVSSISLVFRFGGGVCDIYFTLLILLLLFRMGFVGCGGKQYRRHEG